MSGPVGTVTGGRPAAVGAATLAILFLLVGVLAAAAAPVGHGFRVAFLRDGDVHVLDAATGAETRLTTDGTAAQVWWTADGRASFCTAAGGTSRWRSGNAPERVRDGVWSPDGTAVAFSQPLPGGEPGSAVWLEAGGAPRRVTPEEPWANWHPVAWSPDGAWLALSRVQLVPSPVPTYRGPYPGEGALWLVDRDGGQRREVRLPTPWGGTTRGGWPDVVVWAPAGDRLVVWVGPPEPCISCRLDGLPVVALPPGGGPAVELDVALAHNAASWAPDGSFLVLVPARPTGRVTWQDKHLVRFDPRTGDRRALTADPAWADTSPAVSPDGRRVAFARGRDGVPVPGMGPTTIDLIATRRIWVVGADGTGARQLTDAPGYVDDTPVWTPDGGWVVFVRWARPTREKEPTEVDLWAVRPDGADAHRLTSLGVLPDFTAFGYYGAFGWRRFFALAPR